MSISCFDIDIDIENDRISLNLTIEQNNTGQQLCVDNLPTYLGTDTERLLNLHLKLLTACR